MLFNSLIFIVFFLPIVFLGYFLINQTGKYKFAVTWLILASLFFYAWWNPKYLLLILASILVNYTCANILGRMTNKMRKKMVLSIGIIGNIAVLGYFKYADFFIANINTVFGSNLSLLHLLLPLAISFFTFQQIAYLVDTYRDEVKQYDLLTYLLFITFFPQLIAGPIVNHKDMMPQFASSKNKKINLENVTAGLFIFTIGLAKKVAIADTFAVWANDGFQNYMSLTSIEAWITSLSYTMQLYFDFSGYCDMAIGIALLFNIKLPVNFFSPYRARNIQDFWRRWHITLSWFLTNYIYIPLGGSRKGKLLTYVNIFIIFAISGIWHGAGWTFVIWGVLHGVASIICRAWGTFKIKLPFVISWFLTFMFVNAAWVYFRAESVTQAHVLLKKMIQFDFGSLNDLFSHPLQFETAKTYNYIWITLDDPKLIIPFLVVFLVVALAMKNSIQLLKDFKPNAKSIIWMQICLLSVLGTIFFLHKNSEFLYFNF